MTTSPFNPLGPAHYAPKHQIDSPGPPAIRVGVFYATREGHTQHVAEHVAADLRERGFDVDIVSVRGRFPFPLSDYSAAVLAASVHGGRHENEMVQFVKDHRSGLDRMVTAFLSVTLSEAGAERHDASLAEHEQFVQDVDRMLGKFFEETDWLPTFTRPVAGALLYSRYNFLVRLVMKSIAKKVGAETDTSRDYVYTDWKELDNFTQEFARRLRDRTRTSLEPALFS
jgi:menaquinone-dependent protoporphyrinogen oxidase